MGDTEYEYRQKKWTKYTTELLAALAKIVKQLSTIYGYLDLIDNVCQYWPSTPLLQKYDVLFPEYTRAMFKMDDFERPISSLSRNYAIVPNLPEPHGNFPRNPPKVKPTQVPASNSEHYRRNMLPVNQQVVPPTRTLNRYARRNTPVLAMLENDSGDYDWSQQEDYEHIEAVEYQDTEDEEFYEPDMEFNALAVSPPKHFLTNPTTPPRGLDKPIDNRATQPCRAEALKFMFGPCNRGDSCPFSHDTKLLDGIKHQMRAQLAL
jgi:hypothetical protein